MPTQTSYKIKQLIYRLKIIAYRLIKLTGTKCIYHWVDNWKFNRLGRKPPELMWQALPRCPGSSRKVEPTRPPATTTTGCGRQDSKFDITLK